MKSALAIFARALFTLVVPVVALAHASLVRRAATVQDGVEMRQLAFPQYDWNGAPACGMGTDYGSVASFSPKGRAFVVILKRGDVDTGVSRYTMLRWNVNAWGVGRRNQVLLEMKSSSLDPGIDPASIFWAIDGRSLTFLGEQLSGHEQIYQLDVTSKRLRRLTASAESIVSYSQSADRTALAYEAIEPTGGGLWTTGTLRHGLRVTTQSLIAVTLGMQHYNLHYRVFVKDRDGTREILPMPGSDFRAMPFLGSEKLISMSPDGRYIVVPESVPNTEEHPAWRRYDNPFVRLFVGNMGHASVEMKAWRWSWFQRYVLVDVRSGRSRVLLDAPIVSWARPVIWSPDSRNVIISHTLLPSEVMENSLRGEGSASERRTVEIGVETGMVTPVGRACDQAISWDEHGLICSTAQFSYEKTFAYQVFQVPEGRNVCHPTEWVRYHKLERTWRGSGEEVPPVDVFEREGRNVPPQLYFKVKGRQRAELLLNLNPQFAQVNLAKERLVTWEWTRGHRMTAGLYYPPHYVSGQRYPLVIQTHGFDEHSERFNFWGGSTTSNAARALAGRGIFVLQVGDGDSGIVATPGGQRAEVERAIQIYKSAIAYLSGLGLVDSRKVGIIGWSHTCFFVKWAVTHYPEMFAAASVAEGGDGSYMEYMLNLQADVRDDTLYGGPPFGTSLKSWVENSPIFLVDRVRAPLLLVVLHNELAMYEWEWLNGLRDLRRPVEMLVLDGRTNDGHDLQEPWDILAASGGNVDWFDFWLKGHEDPDPGKAEQYVRWRGLRKLYEQGQSQARGDARAISWQSVE